MDDSISKGESTNSEGMNVNSDLTGENVAFVDNSNSTDDTSSYVNVQDAVQNVQGDSEQQQGAISNKPVDGGDGANEAIVPDDQPAMSRSPTDVDNGNLSGDDKEMGRGGCAVDDNVVITGGEEKESLPGGCPNGPESEPVSSNPEVAIEVSPSIDAEDNDSNNSNEIVAAKDLNDVGADIPFADEGDQKEEANSRDLFGLSPADVKPSEGSNSSSPGAGSSDTAGGSLALPVASTSSGSEVPQSSSSTSVSSDSGASKRRDDSPQSVYHIKWIMFKEKKVPIVTQNENGPCPLLAIVNFLLLKEKVKLPPVMEIITADQLMEYLGDCVFDQVPKNVSEDAQLNIEQNVHDAMSVFHKLQTGLDVNVKFTGVADFEYTSECIIFDILGIPMYHGWLVDPQSPEVQAAVGHSSYNQLVEKIITQKSSEKPELVTEALIAENFLERTAAQLTYHGLCELAISIKEEELGVLFRNNHFSTIYKHKNELFLLVTDQGFLTESNVVWETLSNVEGDGNFVDADFRTYRKPEASTHTIPPPPVPAGSDQQVDQDFLVALSLQQEQQSPPDQAIALPKEAEQATPQSPHQVQSDLQLAMQLQEEENRQAARAQAQAQVQRNNQQQLSEYHQEEMQRQQRQQQEGRRKSGDCSIL